MISHINLGTNDLARAEAFYSELLKAFDAVLAFKSDRTIYYSLGEKSANLAINKPFDGKPASHGNGTMVALAAKDKAQVDAVYNRAIELGGSCEGRPGDRLDGALYAAYFRDPDGNKFGIFVSAR